MPIREILSQQVLPPLTPSPEPSTSQDWEFAVRGLEGITSATTTIPFATRVLCLQFSSISEAAPYCFSKQDKRINETGGFFDGFEPTQDGKVYTFFHGVRRGLTYPHLLDLLHTALEYDPNARPVRIKAADLPQE